MLSFTKSLLIAVAAFALLACSATPTRESTGQYLDSTSITARAKAKLVDELGPESLSIQVKTFKDEVQLSGFVNSPIIKNRAALIVRSIPDVRRVRNDLIVK
ncbi:transporter [Legionella quinlivanii]|uniref:Transporter n=1 Tax=Legionella quinlivanii TaxID=45073 RepID=A0A364LF42_9GAMM|nr:BON domain-containing protein [Legionella quinlivanii]RAP34447.1 transporter [Legionella quinlivanii]